MNSINIKKMVPKFDTDAICSDLPYRIIMNGNTYVGVFYIITEDRLEFKFFDKGGTIKSGIILPTPLDDIEIYPCSDVDDKPVLECRARKEDGKTVVSKAEVIDNGDGSYTAVIPLEGEGGETYFIHEVKAPEIEGKKYTIDEENASV